MTVPVGANPLLDGLLFDRAAPPADVVLRFLVREADGGWREAPAGEARRPYGDPRLARRYPGTTAGRRANAVGVLERGGLL